MAITDSRQDRLGADMHPGSYAVVAASS